MFTAVVIYAVGFGAIIIVVATAVVVTVVVIVIVVHGVVAEHCAFCE